jgi:predicted nucleic acid-binding protein
MPSAVVPAGSMSGGLPHHLVVNPLLAQPPRTLYASELTRFELRRGACLRADPEPLWSKNSRSPPAAGAVVTSRRGDHPARGRAFGAVDTLLAATAQARSLVMVTRNLRHFQGIDGQKLENWFDPPT